MLKDNIRDRLNSCLKETDLGIGDRYEGKVHDCYDIGGKIVIVATDRFSSFDRKLILLPYKGMVNNMLSAWWFERTKHIVENHVIDVPDVNVKIVKKCEVIPIEFVVRGYITGTTKTSLWMNYNDDDVRDFFGHSLPDGLQKNQKLPENILTPTTKDKKHDVNVSADDVVNTGLLSRDEFDTLKDISLSLFEFGQKIVSEAGFILVDTKYEFGKDIDGNILLVDELHTSDSSRYWSSDNYDAAFANGVEPVHYDKEFLRIWYTENSDPYNDKILPIPNEDLIVELSSNYIKLYEKITGNSFDENSRNGIEERIKYNLCAS